jgi:hypothetical protein
VAAILVECTTTAAAVHCCRCGETGTVTRETGDVVDRVRGFAAQHLDPHCVAIRVEANGLDCGWVTVE